MSQTDSKASENGNNKASMTASKVGGKKKDMVYGELVFIRWRAANSLMIGLLFLSSSSSWKVWSEGLQINPWMHVIWVSGVAILGSRRGGRN